MECTYTEQKYQ